MDKLTCGFIGLGLIGGSIAHALREKHSKNIFLIAYDPDTAALRLARKQNVIDLAADRIDDSFSCCDFLFLCAPVSSNNRNLPQIKKCISPSCILTDVGSVKTGIHEEIAAAGLQAQFIGGHPMAGSERTGYSNSRARLLENAYYILTPSEECDPEKISVFQNLVCSMGAIPLILDPQRHDFVTAAVSHLPHVIAASLVNLVKDNDSEEEIMKMIAAGGFKDITRIASSSPEMWRQICTSNADNIIRLLESFITGITAVRNALQNRDSSYLENFFTMARNYRDSFIDASSGPIKKAYDLYVDIADEPGALAPIAALLARHDISIKNIGITHNRETQEGSLRIEFYEESAVGLARRLLTDNGYPIYDRK